MFGHDTTLILSKKALAVSEKAPLPHTKKDDVINHQSLKIICLSKNQTRQKRLDLEATQVIHLAIFSAKNYIKSYKSLLDPEIATPVVIF